MKYDVIVTDAENILELVKHIVDIFGSRDFQIVLFPRLGSEE